jgi:3-deoxy-D-manno-octulosonic-acid transferase
MSAALAVYRALTAALEPLAPLLLNGRAARGKEDLARLGERLGRPAIPRPAGDLIWLHGASVGESLSLLPLIETLARERPDLALLVTSGTVTAAELLARRLPPAAIHQYAPVDAPGVARRFLAHWRPAVAVFVESELWPNLLLQAKAQGVKLALLGARVSQTSADGWARAPVAARTLLGAFDLILTQDAASRERLEMLGAAVDGELDLKQAAAPLPCDEAELSALAFPLRHRPVLVAASTHPGEDEMIAEAFAHTAAPPALLVLVPRHPARADRIAAALVVQGLRYARRSTGEPIRSDTQVYLADTLGELGLFFRLAQAVVMGGSLTGGVGGHNPLEPARLGLPVITGPDVANFRETYAGLLDAHAALMVDGQAALNQAVADLMAHPDRAREIGLRAKAYAERGGQALAAAMAALKPLLPAGAP